MENGYVMIAVAGIMLYRNKLKQLFMENNQSVISIDHALEEALLSLVLSGIYEDALLEKVLGISQSSCQFLRSYYLH